MTSILLAILLSGIATPASNAVDRVLEAPKRVLLVKDYKWASGGMGRPAIMKEITLQNVGKYDYENISIEVDLYTKNDIPLGSLRGTIHDILPHGSEKTFYNLKFGIMSAELQNTIARVAGADLIEKGTPAQAKDLIQVKGWEWTGGQYGTEGVLKSITLVNRSSDNWKDIKIRVDFLGIPGAKVGVRGFTSRAVIHDLLPANGERTYTNINVGFRHPDARSVDISVMSAKPISEKELKVKMAKKEGKRAVKKKKKKSTAQGDGTAAPGEEGGTIPESDKELSLSERYKQKLAQERGEIPETPEAGTGPAEGTESVKDAMTGEGGEETVAAGTEEGGEVVEEEEEYEYEEEVPLPSEDIVVEDLKWGGGVTGTIGKISEITLNNLSDITYAKIELRVEFFSFKEETPMFSNKTTIYEVLPAKSRKTFKNIDAGYLNAIPQEIRVEVINAVPFGQ
ncbi:MAG: hypothetical protein A3J42_09555 [Candidatus Dadabacteria bacterium RIFCSPHIGHO2_12_FULL_53_21]|nr:MAG: hypothetical protein A3J42_09555 [Candidatus Dadabacteria bacterium RIFCSPHIGHO2_12_FULL_53_21]